MAFGAGEFYVIRLETNIVDDKTKRMIIIAYSSGYESGHHDTVEGMFVDCTQTHDEIASEWLEDAVDDDTFGRGLKL